MPTWNTANTTTECFIGWDSPISGHYSFWNQTFQSCFQLPNYIKSFPHPLLHPGLEANHATVLKIHEVHHQLQVLPSSTEETVSFCSLYLYVPARTRVRVERSCSVKVLVFAVSVFANTSFTCPKQMKIGESSDNTR